MSEEQLDLKLLPAGQTPFEFSTEMKPLTAPSGGKFKVSGFQMRGMLHPGKEGVSLQGKLEFSLGMRCSRCAVDFETPVSRPFELLLVSKPFNEFESVDGDASAIDDRLFYAEAGQLTWLEVALEQIYLSLPLKPVCQDGCKGLCVTCGGDRNRVECGCEEEAIDPRFAPLLQFKRQFDDSEETS